ncbi:MAG: hypothetical protein HN855_11685 [Anaerolineae bacterium]|jgi:hypothetical protein|nr:hypothetical protein [Anaerolineae bacterium]MBT7071012.1 hypothetical protein [Anaerolineae bacterium]MBT7325814.1 hypothetical protein [Anaerolineae bacterium]
MDYGYTITRAWKIIWKHKVLWIFGILAGCSANSNNGGSSNTNFSRDLTEMPPEMISLGDKALAFLEQPSVITVLILFALLIIMLTIFLGTIGRIALINGTYKAEAGAEKLTFGELFKDGTSRFWRFFGMNFLVSIPFIIVIGGLIGAAIFTTITADSAANAQDFLIAFIPTLCVLFCCLFFLALIIGTILQQAQNALILEDRGISASLIRGWEVFKNNLGHIFLIAVILFITSVVASLLISLPFLLIVIPTMLSFVLDEAKSMQPLIIMGVGVLAYIPIALLANGILTAYLQAVWTLTYLQLTDQTPEIPKEDRIIEYA